MSENAPEQPVEQVPDEALEPERSCQDGDGAGWGDNDEADRAEPADPNAAPEPEEPPTERAEDDGTNPDARP